ncbi:MAG: hypothetical protein Q7J27_00495 [Syntrophales bacterium]|nr:hypothetical protein [Syntrophales bacterium]
MEGKNLRALLDNFPDDPPDPRDERIAQLEAIREGLERENELWKDRCERVERGEHKS